MTTPTHDLEVLADRADAFVAGMDRTERVAWLKAQGVADVQILDVLLSTEDPELDELTRDHAHGIAIAIADGELAVTPEWLN